MINHRQITWYALPSRSIIGKVLPITIKCSSPYLFVALVRYLQIMAERSNSFICFHVFELDCPALLTNGNSTWSLPIGKSLCICCPFTMYYLLIANPTCPLCIHCAGHKMSSKWLFVSLCMHTDVAIDRSIYAGRQLNIMRSRIVSESGLGQPPTICPNS